MNSIHTKSTQIYAHSQFSGKSETSMYIYLSGTYLWRFT